MKIGMIAGNTGNIRSGIGNYIFNLTNELEKNHKTDITIIGQGDQRVFGDIHLRYPYYPKIRYNFILWSQFISIQKNCFADFDLVHNPAHFPCMTKPGKNYVCTIHDMTPVLFPAWHQLHRVVSSKLSFPLLMHHSDKIIADSSQTKNDIRKCYRVPEGKITVVYLGADKEFRPLDDHAVQSVRNCYNLNFPFILFVGTLEPRKNIPVLLKAFSSCQRKIQGLKLVIVGNPGWKYEEIFTTIRNLHLDEKVIFLQYVPHEDLPGIYNAADLFVYPSLYEGFGLPPLEAMQCGIPVITSNTSSLPEVMGNEGMMVNSSDIGTLADYMYLLLSDDRSREVNIEYNLNRSALFSWEKCARETQDIYYDVVQGNEKSNR